MSESSSPRVACPACGSKYRWTAELAGRKVACKCGAVLRMPADASGAMTLERAAEKPAAPAAPKAPAPKPTGPVAATNDDYELADPELAKKPAASAAKPPTKPLAPVPPKAPAAPAAGRCPSCGQPVKPTAVICVNCGFNLAEGKKLKTNVAADDAAAPPAAAVKPGTPAQTKLELERVQKKLKAKAEDQAVIEEQSKWTEIYIPLILLGAGVVLILLNAFVLAPWAANSAAASWGDGSTAFDDAQDRLFYSLTILAIAGVRFVIQFPALLVGIFIVARMFGTSYGSLFTGVLKLAALALVVGGFNDCIDAGMDITTGGFGCMGWMFRFALGYGLFTAIAMKLFDMDTGESMVLYLCVILLPVIAMIFLAGVILGMLA